MLASLYSNIYNGKVFWQICFCFCLEQNAFPIVQLKSQSMMATPIIQTKTKHDLFSLSRMIMLTLQHYNLSICKDDEQYNGRDSDVNRALDGSTCPG
jgi:hypothetical protein